MKHASAVKAEIAVYNLLRDHAEAGRPCPTNGQIYDATGNTNGSALVRRLEDSGMISVWRGRRFRVITITETGKSTAGSMDGDEKPKRDAVRPTSYGEVSPVAVRVSRDVCFCCGIPRDRHDDLGCKRWRSAL